MSIRNLPLWGRVGLLASMGIAPVVVAPAAHATSFFTDLSNTLPSIYTYGGSNGATVGWGEDGASLYALYWDTTNAAINLNPTAILGSNSASLALGVSGDRIVGWGLGDATNGSTHALVWNGFVASDLHPTAIFGDGYSAALGINGAGDKIVGYGAGAGLDLIGNWLHRWATGSGGDALGQWL